MEEATVLEQQIVTPQPIIKERNYGLDLLKIILFENRQRYKNFLTKLDNFPYWVVNKLNKNEGENV